jgi:hypothetical protein
LPPTARRTASAWPAIDFNAAKLIVSFSADFLDAWGHRVPQQLDWADARAKLEGAPKLVYIGARRSLTGLNADQWIPAKAGSEMAICNAILGRARWPRLPRPPMCRKPPSRRSSLRSRRRQRRAGDLRHDRRPTPSSAATMVADINKANGSVGTTINPAAAHAGYEGMASYLDLVEATERMAPATCRSPSSATPTRRTACRPVPDSPRRSPRSASRSRSRLCPTRRASCATSFVPDNHWLESWGDAMVGADQRSLQQPTLEPVFDTRSTADVLIAAARADRHDRVALPAGRLSQLAHRQLRGRLGRVRHGAHAAHDRRLAGGIARHAHRRLPRGQRGRRRPATCLWWCIPSATLGDGVGANKPWLQELPDPVTKIAWQSWVEIHPMTAKQMGVKEGEHLTVKTAAGEITAPAYIYMGVRPDTVAVALGQGHTAYGRFAQNIGVNAYTS